MPHIQDVIERIETDQLERNEFGELHYSNLPHNPAEDPDAVKWLYDQLWPKATADAFSEQDLIGIAA